MRRWTWALALLGSATLPAGAQETVRWNDVVRSLDHLEGEPPAVRVRLEKRAPFFAEPIRVFFSVAEDAFVVVGRVDGDGRLTVLFPAGRSRATSVKAGEEHFIRGSRLGGLGTFPANERPGATGFVFALASRSPLDLSRLGQRDFSSWITGNQVGQPVSRYFGDPYRVVQRFARVVSYSQDTDFDFDVEFYSVDMPLFAGASAFSSCGYFAGAPGAALAGAMLNTRWNRNFWNEYGEWQHFDPCQPFLNCLIPTMNGFGYPMLWSSIAWAGGLGCGNPMQVASQQPMQPLNPPRTPLDSMLVNPWAADSIQRPNPAVDPRENGPHIMTERPAPGTGWSDREDLSFSIPARALRNLRSVSREPAPTPISAPGGITSGPMPMPARPEFEARETPVEWVRPPRSFDAADRDPADRLPTRFARRETMARDAEMPTRPGRNGLDGPPPRGSSPMFDREPGRNSTFVPMIRHEGGMNWNSTSGGGMYNPPTYLEGRPATPSTLGTGSGGMVPTITTGTSGSSTGSTTGTTPPPAGSSSSGTSGSSGSERKPQQQ